MEKEQDMQLVERLSHELYKVQESLGEAKQDRRRHDRAGAEGSDQFSTIDMIAVMLLQRLHILRKSGEGKDEYLNSLHSMHAELRELWKSDFGKLPFPDNPFVNAEPSDYLNESSESEKLDDELETAEPVITFANVGKIAAAQLLKVDDHLKNQRKKDQLMKQIVDVVDIDAVTAWINGDTEGSKKPIDRKTKKKKRKAKNRNMNFQSQQHSSTQNEIIENMKQEGSEPFSAKGDEQELDTTGENCQDDGVNQNEGYLEWIEEIAKQIDEPTAVRAAVLVEEFDRSRWMYDFKRANEIEAELESMNLVIADSGKFTYCQLDQTKM
uniref:Uncharacterized protein n=1 Tax=Aplanochytrium stocchinoi TaxID=215587 RepID=A0A7S3V1V3_9STRA